MFCTEILLFLKNKFLTFCFSCFFSMNIISLHSCEIVTTNSIREKERESD